MVGIVIAVMPLPQALYPMILSSSVKRFGAANLLFLAILTAFCGSFFHIWFSATTPIYFIVIAFLLLGINWTIANTVMYSAVNQVIPMHKIAGAVGTISTIWSFAGSILLSGGSAVFDSVEKKSSFLPAFHASMYFNFIATAVVLAAAIWVMVSMRKKREA